MAQQTKIGSHATAIFIENGITTVRYHSTDIVKFGTGRITLNTGGYFTVTTKTRMNQASSQFDLGYKVYQSKSHWYVEYHGRVLYFKGNTLTLDRS